MKSRKKINPGTGDKEAAAADGKTMKSRKRINQGTGDKEAAAADGKTTKSRKRINPGTGDKDAAVGCDLFISTIGGGGGKLVSREVKQRGRRPLTIWTYPEEPSSETENKIVDSKLVDEYANLINNYYYGNGTYADIDAFEARFNVEEVEEHPCETCFGEWHRPLTIEPRPVPPTPEDPTCYLACECCLGKEFDEETADCARCGSTAKFVLPKSCIVCHRAGDFDNNHFDNTDKECPFYGKKDPDLKNNKPGIKKELDMVVPGDLASTTSDDASIASPQAKGKRKVADPQLRKTPRRSLRTRGSSSGC